MHKKVIYFILGVLNEANHTLHTKTTRESLSFIFLINKIFRFENNIRYLNNLISFIIL